MNAASVAQSAAGPSNGRHVSDALALFDETQRALLVSRGRVFLTDLAPGGGQHGTVIARNHDQARSIALRRRLPSHARFGPSLRDWREQGAVPLRVKLMAVAGMSAGYALCSVASEPGLLAAWSVRA